MLLSRNLSQNVINSHSSVEIAGILSRAFLAKFRESNIFNKKVIKELISRFFFGERDFLVFLHIVSVISTSQCRKFQNLESPKMLTMPFLESQEFISSKI